jgi:hypothetical protein
MKFYEKSNSFLNPPFFISMTTAAKLVQPIAICLAYLIQLDVDVIGNITAKLCEVGSEFNIVCTCNGNSSSYYYFFTHFCPLDFSEIP